MSLYEIELKTVYRGKLLSYKRMVTRIIFDVYISIFISLKKIMDFESATPRTFKFTL